MTEIKEFVKQISNFYYYKHPDAIVIFAYFLEKHEGFEHFTSTEISKCYTKSDFPKPKNISDFMKKLASSDRLIEEKKGFHLSGKEIEQIEQQILGGPSLISIKEELNDLPNKLTRPEQRTFIDEILNCLRVQAWRGVIVLTWILTLDHLQKYVLENNLDTFNDILHGTKLYTNVSITKQEDFEEIKDLDFLKTLRTCGVIGSTKFKILQNSLDERNRYAHPTDVTITDSIATSFIENLVHNIILKIN